MRPIFDHPDEGFGHTSILPLWRGWKVEGSTAMMG
jgi:hypothetical protein